MKDKGVPSDLSLFYERAKKGYEECIGKEDNLFLQEEVSIPLNDISVFEKDIKIVFSKRAFDEYVIEVCLLLFDGSKEIGKYVYVENENNEAVDDFLIFY